MLSIESIEHIKNHRLRLDRNHSATHPNKAADSATHVSANIKAEITGSNKLTIEALDMSGLPGLAVVHHKRPRDSP